MSAGASAPLVESRSTIVGRPSAGPLGTTVSSAPKWSGTVGAMRPIPTCPARSTTSESVSTLNSRLGAGEKTLP